MPDSPEKPVRLSTSAAGARLKPDDLDFEVRRLQRRVDRLVLASQAMWELLREHTELGDEDLTARIHEIHLRDGVSSEGQSRKTVICPECRRPSASKLATCLYCGADFPDAALFDTI